MRLASEVAQQGQDEGQSEEQPAGASPSRDSDARGGTPVVESPPTSPPHSPWWTAPGGKPVNIPDFGQVLFVGHVLLDALIALLAPAPQPVPIRIRTKR